VPEDIALFIDFENIRYSMLNIQRREPDPQELIAVARRYGTVMVARAYADWSRQPEPFKGSLTAAMIDRVDCPAKQRDRIRMGTGHYPSPNSAPGQDPTYPSYRQWPTGPLGNSGPLPAISPQQLGNDWPPYQETPGLETSDTEEHSSINEEHLGEETWAWPTISSASRCAPASHLLAPTVSNSRLASLAIPPAPIRGRWDILHLPPYNSRLATPAICRR